LKDWKKATITQQYPHLITKRLQYYDSMGGTGLVILNGLKMCLKYEVNILLFFFVHWDIFIQYLNFKLTLEEWIPTISKQAKKYIDDPTLVHLLDIDSWQLVRTIRDATPQQDNGYDCGVCHAFQMNFMTYINLNHFFKRNLCSLRSSFQCMPITWPWACSCAFQLKTWHYFAREWQLTFSMNMWIK
jgi:hypothetical protein